MLGLYRSTWAVACLEFWPHTQSITSALANMMLAVLGIATAPSKKTKTSLGSWWTLQAPSTPVGRRDIRFIGHNRTTSTSWHWPRHRRSRTVFLRGICFLKSSDMPSYIERLNLDSLVTVCLHSMIGLVRVSSRFSANRLVSVSTGELCDA